MKSSSIEAFDTSVNPHLGAVISLPEFIAVAGELTPAERRTIVEQALVLIEDIYVHLPLKRAMHAVDPVQQLKLLRRKLDRLTERQFHNEMIQTFKRLRDLHTNYILPAPYNQHTAFLPFLMEEFYDGDGRRHYLVTRVFQGFQHPTFGPGVEVTHWSGVPIDRAVEINADREAGSNEAARHVRGLDNMTVRPMLMSLPPDAEWEVVSYRTEDSDLEIRLPWQVFRPDPGPAADPGTGGGSTDVVAASIGLDLEMEMTNRARKILFAPEVVDRQKEAADLRAQGDALDLRLQTFQAENSLFPDTFEFRTVVTDHGTFGYLRIRTFSAPGPDAFLAEVIRIVGLLPQNGLIIDVRNNGGGIILNGERMLQLFVPGPVEAERLHFINTEVTAAIARSSALGGFARRWLASIELAVVTGAVYSQGFPLEPQEATNALGRHYEGPVVLITDARCYSTTDFFAAGFQDNGLGPVLGVDDNTGAGGANVFRHSLLQTVLQGPDSPIHPLPKGADMRVALRMSTRVKDRAGLPLEDLGVEPDAIHRLTRRDLLEGNRDLINEAGRILAGGALRRREIFRTGAAVRTSDNAPSDFDARGVFPRN
jgi:C-terminal processing protease CtpA/Prc